MPSASTIYPSFSPLKAPPQGETEEIIVQATLTIAGVNANNFDSLKASLKNIIATVLNVDPSKLTISYASNSRRFLSEGNVLCEITATSQAESAAVVSEFRAPDFTQQLNNEIVQEANTNTAFAALSVTSVSSVTLVTTTRTPTKDPTTATTTTTTTLQTTTTAGGSSALFACFALVMSALVL